MNIHVPIAGRTPKRTADALSQAASDELSEGIKAVVRGRVSIRNHRLDAMLRAKKYRADFRSLKEALRILGMWEACQTDAGGYGDLYTGKCIPDALDLAKRCWNENIWEMNRHNY